MFSLAGFVSENVAEVTPFAEARIEYLASA
jgi:hypothetical protein